MAWKHISIDEAKAMFPGAMEDPNAAGFGSDPAGHDVLFIDDGELVMGNTLDDMYDVWVDGLHWEEWRPEQEEEEND